MGFVWLLSLRILLASFIHVVASVNGVFLSWTNAISLYGYPGDGASPIWKLKADFYEEAMKKSDERAELNSALTDGRVAKRDKERSDKITRDGLNRGEGASVFLHKALYNRRRFSYFGFLTKTSVFYLSVGTLVSLLLRFVIGYNSFIPIGLGLCLVVFFRSLGNPLAQDMSSVYFMTVPASAHEKVFFSLIGGTLSCALDVLPCVLLSALLLSASLLEVIAFYLLAVCVDFYASNVMLFIEFSLPSSLSLQVKQLVSILFIYFGILPMAIVVAIGALLGFFEAFLFIASAVAFAIGGVVYAFTPLFIANGKK